MILVGCSGSPDRSEPELGPLPVIRSNAELAKVVLPLDPYMDDLAFVDLTERAGDVLAQRCMRRFGLTWPRYRPVKDPHRPEHLRRWGIVDPDEVARYGYLPPEARDAEERPEPSVSADADAVAAGRVSEYKGMKVPERGCFGEAADILAGEKTPRIADDVGLPRRLSNEAYHYAEQDSRVHAAFWEWSACMREAGFDYQIPLDASGDLAWDGPAADRPTAKELATAKADIACRLRINLVGLLFAVDAAYQQRALDANVEEVKKEGEKLRAMEAKAREVLGE